MDQRDINKIKHTIYEDYPELIEVFDYLIDENERLSKEISKIKIKKYSKLYIILAVIILITIATFWWTRFKVVNTGQYSIYIINRATGEVDWILQGRNIRHIDNF